MPATTPPRSRAAAASPATVNEARRGKTEQRSYAHAQEPAREARPPGAWIEPYLTFLALTGLKMVAYRKAGVNASTVMKHRDRDAEFEKREEVAMRKALKNVVEPAIIKRATVGNKKVRFGRDGKILSIEYEASDTLALRLAERLETGSWRQKQQIEHSGGVTFKSRADRKAALEKAEASLRKGPVTAAESGRN